MTKGSQLKQLKSALSQAGLTGKPQAGKKRKRDAPTQKDKERKAARLEEINRKLNPFDVKVTKVKHDVGGRKIKGAVGHPAQSRQASLEQRKKTLLKALNERGRAGGIVDRRFGENDPTMSIEERMLERFTRERQRSSKGASFNLEDEDELTHYGQSLSKLDDFDDVGLGDEEEEEDEEGGRISKEIVKLTHFGGFEDEETGDGDDPDQPARKKAKAEVMAEVIAKSKRYKAVRQMEKEEGENVRHELDQEFASLRELLYAPDPSATSTRRDLIKPDPQVNETTELALPSVLREGMHDTGYDQQVRELAFGARSKPKDRLKTEEEIALEEKEALEKAERRRQRRMSGMGEDESDEEGPRSKRKRGGDDLDDDLHEDEWVGLGGGLEETRQGLDSESGGEDTNEDEGVEQNSESEVEGEDDEGSDDESAEEWEGDDDSKGEHENLVATTSLKQGRVVPVKKKELPYTFPCPESHDGFLNILADVEEGDVPVVVKRIRALFHTSLAPGNKFKLQAFMTVLIDHILYITTPPKPQFTLLSSLLPHLFTLAKAYPVRAAECFNEKLAMMHKNLIRGLSHGVLSLESETWPGLAELSLLRVIGTIWSTSDLNHAVISPARILMGSYLALGRVRSLSDLASGLFLCTLFLQFEAFSKRLVPEAVVFLINTILHLSSHSYEDASSIPGSFPTPDFRSDLCRPLVIDLPKSKRIQPQKGNISLLLHNKTSSEQSKVDILALALMLLGRFADMYKSIDGFVELYEPALVILHVVSVPANLEVQVAALRGVLQRLVKFAKQDRKPLMLQAHKPIPIPSYVPKFEISSSSYLRNRDPDHDKNEAAKLRAQYKQERKGAIRELRKDARFLAVVEQQKQKEKDKMYKDRMSKVFGSIEGERAEEKAMEREKQREKRRGGRK